MPGRVRGHFRHASEYPGRVRTKRGTAVPGRVHGRDAHATPNNWHLLRDRRLGLKFRRQYLNGNDIVDFYCCECRLAIELGDCKARRSNRPLTCPSPDGHPLPHGRGLYNPV